MAHWFQRGWLLSLSLVQRRSGWKTDWKFKESIQISGSSCHRETGKHSTYWFITRFPVHSYSFADSIRSHEAGKVDPRMTFQHFYFYASTSPSTFSSVEMNKKKWAWAWKINLFRWQQPSRRSRELELGPSSFLMLFYACKSFNIYFFHEWNGLGVEKSSFSLPVAALLRHH